MFNLFFRGKDTNLSQIREFTEKQILSLLRKKTNLSLCILN